MNVLFSDGRHLISNFEIIFSHVISAAGDAGPSEISCHDAHPAGLTWKFATTDEGWGLELPEIRGLPDSTGDREHPRNREVIGL